MEKNTLFNDINKYIRYYYNNSFTEKSENVIRYYYDVDYIKLFKISKIYSNIKVKKILNNNNVLFNEYDNVMYIKYTDELNDIRKLYDVTWDIVRHIIHSIFSKIKNKYKTYEIHMFI